MPITTSLSSFSPLRSCNGPSINRKGKELFGDATGLLANVLATEWKRAVPSLNKTDVVAYLLKKETADNLHQILTNANSDSKLQEALSGPVSGRKLIADLNLLAESINRIGFPQENGEPKMEALKGPMLSFEDMSNFARELIELISLQHASLITPPLNETESVA